MRSALKTTHKSRPTWVRARSWLPFVLALPLTAATLGLHLFLHRGVVVEELFNIPIIICAYLGGLLPGLFATAVSATAMLVLLAGEGSFSLSSLLANPDWLPMVLVGFMVSGLIEAQRRSRKRTERARRDLEVTLESIGDAVIRTNEEGVVTFMNPAAELLTGWGEREAAGLQLDTVVRVTRGTAGGTESRSDFPAATNAVLLTRLGREVPISGATNSIGGDGDESRGSVMIFRDAIAERAARTALEERLSLRDELARIVKTAPGILYSFKLRPDGSACVPFATDSIRSIFGVDASELARDASRIFEMMVPADAIECQRLIRESAASLAPFFQRFRVRRQDGVEVCVEAHSIPVREADGSVIWHGFINDVTERTRVDDALKMTQSRLQLLIEQAPVSIAILDKQMNYLAASRRWRKVYGHELSELVGRNHYDVLPDLPEEWRVIHRECLAGAVRASDDDVWLRSNGTRSWLRWAIHPWHDANGDVGGIIIFAEDITDRKQAEEAMHASERRYRELVQMSPDAIVLARQGRIEFANAAAVGLVAAPSAESLIGRSVIEIAHPDDRPLVQERALELKTGEACAPLRHRVVRDDGASVDVESVAALLADDSGTAVQIVIRDITERLRAERALRASDARFRQLAESIAEVFWMSNPDATVVEYVSPAYESIWGRSCESLYASPQQWLEAIHELDRDRMLDVLARQANGYEAEYRIVRPDGTIRWIRDRGFPVLNESGGVLSVAGVAEDITASRELELQLQQAQKLESVGLLAGGVAHDFNNWLTVISANGQLLKSTIASDDEGLELVNEILDAGNRAAGVTRQLLALSRQQVLEPQVVDLNSVVTDTEKLLRRLIGEDVVLTTELCAVDRVMVDPGHMSQVLMNLAVNARDAMPTGGRLTVSTDVTTIDPGSLRSVTGRRAGRYVRLSVADTGVGMTADVRARVFDPFFTTKGLGRGTGLGLSVVHGIVVQSGGYIDVESTVGKGTTFHILLPALDGPEAEPPSACGVTEVRGSETIMLVEDEDGVRRVAVRALKAAGYQVIDAVDGIDAMRQYERHRDAIDMVVTDVVMPRMGGRQFVDTLPETIPVLYTSGYPDDAIVRHGVAHAEVAFLEKPYSARELVSKVREVLDRYCLARR